MGKGRTALGQDWWAQPILYSAIPAHQALSTTLHSVLWRTNSPGMVQILELTCRWESRAASNTLFSTTYLQKTSKEANDLVKPTSGKQLRCTWTILFNNWLLGFFSWVSSPSAYCIIEVHPYPIPQAKGCLYASNSLSWIVAGSQTRSQHLVIVDVYIAAAIPFITPNINHTGRAGLHDRNTSRLLLF